MGKPITSSLNFYADRFYFQRRISRLLLTFRQKSSKIEAL